MLHTPCLAKGGCLRTNQQHPQIRLQAHTTRRQCVKNRIPTGQAQCRKYKAFQGSSPGRAGAPGVSPDLSVGCGTGFLNATDEAVSVPSTQAAELAPLTRSEAGELFLRGGAALLLFALPQHALGTEHCGIAGGDKRPIPP